MNKTLIGKDNYLFLINDSCKELEVHCNNLNLVSDKNLTKYKELNKFLLIIFPNKSLIYKHYLPDNYKVKYRPALDDYKCILKNKVIDMYDVLKTENDVYYKTDTHINMKGNYIVYKNFIENLNKIYDLNIEPKDFNMKSKICNLTTLQLGLGDLLWESNLGQQVVEENTDIFYYSDEIEYIYCKYFIKPESDIKILDNTLTVINNELTGSVLSWDILSKFILYKQNNDKKYTVVIFYDSFLTSFLSVYLEMFEHVYMIKSIYNSNFIKILNPDFIFEFRVERFLF
jgi:hypothetical protein